MNEVLKKHRVAHIGPAAVVFFTQFGIQRRLAIAVMGEALLSALYKSGLWETLKDLVPHWRRGEATPVMHSPLVTNSSFAESAPKFQPGGVAAVVALRSIGQLEQARQFIKEFRAERGGDAMGAILADEPLKTLLAGRRGELAREGIALVDSPPGIEALSLEARAERWLQLAEAQMVADLEFLKTNVKAASHLG